MLLTSRALILHFLGRSPKVLRKEGTVNGAFFHIEGAALGLRLSVLIEVIPYQTLSHHQGAIERTGLGLAIWEDGRWQRGFWGPWSPTLLVLNLQSGRVRCREDLLRKQVDLAVRRWPCTFRLLKVWKPATKLTLIGAIGRPWTRSRDLPEKRGLYHRIEDVCELKSLRLYILPVFSSLSVWRWCRILKDFRVIFPLIFFIFLKRSDSNWHLHGINHLLELLDHRGLLIMERKASCNWRCLLGLDAPKILGMQKWGYVC